MLETLYHNCDLPFPLFELATVTGELSHIVKIETDEVDEDKRKEAWLNINDEYLQITGDTVAAGYSSDLNEHAKKTGKIITFTALCDMAQNTPHEGILKHLREFFPQMNFPIDNPEQLEAELDRVKLMLERDMLEAEQLEKKLADVENEPKDEDVARPTQETFDRIKIAINDHKKMVYDFTKITTRQYAILVKSLKDVKPQHETYAA